MERSFPIVLACVLLAVYALILIIVGVLLVAGVFIGLNQYKAGIIEKNSNLNAEISINGELYKIVSLEDNEQEIEIETELGRNVIKIHNKGAEVIEADCPDHVCIDTGFKDRAGDMIVCLPNKVAVEIKGNTEVEIDELSN